MAPASLYTLLAQYRRATARVRSVGTFGGRPVEVKVATELPRYYAARQPAGGTVEAENGGGARHENVRVCLSVKVSTEDPLSTKPPSRVVVEVACACHAKPAAATLPPPRRRRTRPSGPWTCPTCTLENGRAYRECTMCGTAAPTGSPEPAPPVPAGPAAAWACARCTLHNDATATACAACGAAAPVVTTTAPPAMPPPPQASGTGAAATAGERLLCGRFQLPYNVSPGQLHSVIDGVLDSRHGHTVQSARTTSVFIGTGTGSGASAAPAPATRTRAPAGGAGTGSGSGAGTASPGGDGSPGAWSLASLLRDSDAEVIAQDEERGLYQLKVTRQFHPDNCGFHTSHNALLVLGACRAATREAGVACLNELTDGRAFWCTFNELQLALKRAAQAEEWGEDVIEQGAPPWCCLPSFRPQLVP